METVFEKYLRIKDKWGELAVRKNELEKRFQDEEREYRSLKEKAAKAALLGDEKNAVTLNERLKQLEGNSPKKELQELPFSIKVLEDEMTKIRPAAVEEIRQKCLGPYKKKILTLYERLKEVAKLEEECEEIFDEAQALSRKVEAPGSGLPRINRLVSSPPWEPMGQSPFGAFVRDLKNNGLDLGVDLP